jgi:hypothetical protein
LGAAAVAALAGESFAITTRRLLELRLTANATPAPTVERVLALSAHNIPIAAWPLLLGVMGTQRHRLGRRIADTVVIACIMANVLPVGAALGSYGPSLLPYVPQLPLEWAGLALGASSWLVQRRGALTLGEGLVWLFLIVGALLCAAVLETVGVPHR